MIPRIIFGVLALIASAQLSWAQGPVQEPGGTAADAQLAVTKPDEFAWRLFLFLNRQASDGIAGVADPTKSILQFDPDKAVVWETWALASGSGSSQQGSEVYKPRGEKPGEWQDLPRSATAPVPKVFSVPTKSILSSLRGQPSLLVAPLDPLGQEVRMNQATFNFVRDQGLYFTQGLEAKLTLAKSVADQLSRGRQGDQGAVEKARHEQGGRGKEPISLAKGWKRPLQADGVARHHQGPPGMVLVRLRACRF